MEKGFDIRTILKAKMTTLRQRLQNKPMTSAQKNILEAAYRKNTPHPHPNQYNDWSEYCEYDDYNDCHGDYYDAE